MLGLVERLDRTKRKAAKYTGGAVAIPPYRGDIHATYRKLYPSYLEAPHLDPLFEAFERAKRGEAIRACFSYAPRAGKTETLIAGCVDRLRWNAASRIMYGSYGGNFAKKKSARIRQFSRTTGVPIDPSTRSKQDWSTGIGIGGGEPGGLWATSVEGAATGMGFDLVVLDDLVKGREEAESLAMRDRAYEWVKTDIVNSRLEPDGSAIVCGTRWHEDDPIGRLVAEGWEEYVIPALSPELESYWPERWPVENLLAKRTALGGEDGYDWCSLYMGEPRAQGEAIFHDAQLFDALPPGPCRIGIGIDFAYTVKKSSDYSCAVVMAEVSGVYYVVDVVRVKVQEADFRARIKALSELYETQTVTGYIAATEASNITLLQRDDVPAFGMRALADKKTRALPSAAGWNLGRIRVRSGQPWTKDFLREVVSFTGADRRDDQVDALAAIYDVMHVSAPLDWDFLNRVREASPRAFELTQGLH